MIRSRKRLICDLRLKSGLWIIAAAVFFVPGPAAYAAEVGLVCFKETCFRPEIARAQSQKQHGLMNRTGLTREQGMLFIYEKEVQPVFWMKNMLMPLDFIWLNGENRIVDISQNVPACKNENCPTISGREPVQYVLEVSAGSIQKSGIKIGDQAVVKLGEINAD